MNFKHLFTVLGILFAFTMNAQNKAVLSGTVKTDQGKLVKGATVKIVGSDTKTIATEDGKFTFENLVPQEYSLSITFKNYFPLEKTITLTSGQNSMDFTLDEIPSMLEGIVVTAQKREQKNKDVPIAITSYGNEFITKQGTFEYDALSDFVPGFQVQIQSVNNPGVVIRGITSDSGDSRVEPRVSIFQDGVSISKSRGSVVELYDVERVEVLKGPQGTLFGRGAQIGAMHIIQNKAKNETSGSLKVGYGNFNQVLTTAYFNTPLIKDKLFIRAAGIYNGRDGYIENRSGGDLNGKQTLAFRTALKYVYSNNTKIDVIANWQKDTPPGTSFKSGRFAPLGGDLSPNSFADLERGNELGVDRTVQGITAIIKHKINSNWDLTSTSAYRDFASDEAFDADGTAAPALYFKEVADGKQISQELRFNFDNSSKFRGFFGGNFFAEKGKQYVPWFVNEQSFAMLLLNPSNFVVNGVPQFLPNIPNDPATFGPAAGLPLSASNFEGNTNYSKNASGDIFADGSYDLTSKFSITAGLRGTWENSNAGYRVQNATTASNAGFLTGAYPNSLFVGTNGERIEANKNFLSVVGRFALNYMLNDNITLFGTTSRGRRPNVINITAANTKILANEIVWSYEVGAKSLFLNNSLQFDVNAYIYNYSNFQTNVTTFVDGVFLSTTQDSGNASSFGFEAAFQYALSRHTSFFANYGYIDASFDDEDANGNKQALAGNTFRLTPKHSVSAGLDLNIAVNKSTEFFFRPSYTYKSKVFFEETNLPNISQAGYGMLNSRVGFIINKKYELNFYMNNIFDKKFIVDAGNTGGAFGIPTFIAGPPRLFGVQASAKF
ncbi:TonB-dependent receptor [Flavobacterium sp. 14A]|uniref:TonB-dependent receptor n=1 Tax=Flavobacterium sp. 14A TaxID=2735896 RepID=UPI0020C65CAD|nr:TonB-dependent receptor [Flavobacterium sp. 14A]NRT12836.1 outer membrane receptor protein involved in Fe transport [Flavobacterium sp. 14A]